MPDAPEGDVHGEEFSEPVEQTTVCRDERAVDVKGISDAFPVR